MKSVNRKWLKSFAFGNKNRYEVLLKQFVEIPTVSSDPESGLNIKNAADLAISLLRSLGGRATLCKTTGNPVVFGSFPFSSKAPTVTVYNHLDVQPAYGGDGHWRTDPFRFHVRQNRYFGRGTTDDKGPALSALFGALAAQELETPVNIQFLWEFEEEIGSPHFAEAGRKISAGHRSDVIVISDTVWESSSRPSTIQSFRGFLGLQFSLQTAETDQHSGDTGGAARNPVGELMALICEIHDPVSGEVRIPGFYDSVRQVDPSELRTAVRSGLSVAEFKKAYQFKSLRTQNSTELIKRIWFQPTFEVHGISGGYSGPGIKAIVPPSARAITSFRLVPDQDPKEIKKLVRRFVREKNADVRVKILGSVPPYRSDAGGPLRDALANAFLFAFGKPPVDVRGGGTIGAVEIMHRSFRCPIQFLGLSLPEHGYHAPNENFDWKQASGGILAFAKYFHEIARIGKNRIRGHR